MAILRNQIEGLTMRMLDALHLRRDVFTCLWLAGSELGSVYPVFLSKLTQP